MARPDGTSRADELGADLLRRGGSLRIKARGGSMMPFLWDGDVAVVAPTEESEIRVGDVLCYETSGSIVLHRLIERGEDRLLTKGDALAYCDMIDRGQVLGKVVAIERRGKVRRLDTRAARRLSHLMVFLSPLFPPLLALAILARRSWRALSRG